MRSIITILLLICSTAQAQVSPAQLRKSLDSVAALSRAADAKQDARLAALEAGVVTLRRGTVDTLNRLSVLLDSIGRRVSQLGASLSGLNATVAGNIASDNAQAAAIKAAQDSLNALQLQVTGEADRVRKLIEHLKATPQ